MIATGAGESRCPNGHTVLPGELFCGQCGAAVAENSRRRRSVRAAALVGVVLLLAGAGGAVFAIRARASAETAEFCEAAAAFASASAVLSNPSDARRSDLRSAGEAIADRGRRLADSSPDYLREDGEKLAAEFVDKAELYASEDYDYHELSRSQQRNDAGLPADTYDSGETIGAAVSERCEHGFEYLPSDLPSDPVGSTSTTERAVTTTSEPQVADAEVCPPLDAYENRSPGPERSSECLLIGWTLGDRSAPADYADDETIAYLFDFEPPEEIPSFFGCEDDPAHESAFDRQVCSYSVVGSPDVNESVQVYLEGGASLGYTALGVGVDENPPNWIPVD